MRDCCDQRIQRSGGSLSQQGFEFGEELFDWIEVGAIGRQVAEFGAGGFDRLLDASNLVARKIVHNDDVAWAERWDKTLLHVGEEARAIDWTVEHTGCGDLVDPQGRDECGRLPMTPRHAGEEALATRAAPIAARHIGRRARLVDEDQALRAQLALACAPFVACRRDIRPILLGSSL